MARIRTIKPEFWTSAQVMECSPNARLLFLGMLNFADDAGRMTYSPKTLKAQIYPSDDISSAEVERMIVELSTNGLLLIYSAEGKEFISITGWHHQKIDKPRPSKLPAPFDDGSTTGRRKVATDPIYPEGKGRDPIQSDSAASAAGADAPPDPPPDHRKRLFSEGLAALARITGKGPDACRSFVGKCLKQAGDDAVTVLGLIEDAERNQTVDPAAWIAARLKAREQPNGRRTVHDAARDLHENLLERIAAFDEPAPGSIRDGTGADVVRMLPARGRE